MTGGKKRVIKWENILIVPFIIQSLIWIFKSDFKLISFIISYLLILITYKTIEFVRKKELASVLEKLIG